MTNGPKDRGTAWERRVADHAAAAGLPWDRAPLRGSNDLLDIAGSLPDGFLVGCKAISRKGNLADRLSAAMEQGRQALANLDRLYPGHSGGVIPVQIVQRQAYPVGRAYWVMEYDDGLRLVQRLRELRYRLETADAITEETR